MIFCYVGSIYLVESGSHKPLQGTYTASDVLEVRLAANGVVTYAKGGSVFYTSTTSPAAHYPLYAAAAIYSPINPALSNVQYVAVGSLPPPPSASPLPVAGSEQKKAPSSRRSELRVQSRKLTSKA